MQQQSQRPQTPEPHPFTEEQIRAKAQVLWEQRGEDSTAAENWADAIRALQRERAIKRVTKPLRRLWWKTGLGTPLQRWWHWTGIQEKKGWDFLQLLVAPLVLAVIGFGLQEYVKEHDQQVAEAKVQQDRQLADDRARQDRQLVVDKNEKDIQLAEDKAKQDTLVKYLDQMADSLQHGLLKAKPGDNQFIVAQSRTVLALQSLDRKRQHLVIQFLSASGLNDTPNGNWQPRDKQDQRTPLPAQSRVLLYQSQMSKANLVNSDLSGGVLIGANLERANLYCLSQERKEPDQCSDLTRADLRFARLSGAALNRADLSNANLGSADLNNAYLSNADLSNADLSNTNLVSAYLDHTNLSDTNFGDANLYRADLRSASLSGAYLDYAHLDYANLRGAHLDYANLRGAYLGYANLEGTVLWGTNLRSADLSFAILLNSDLSQATGLTPQQLEGEDPPFLCNVALPKEFTVNPNRDCDRLPQILLERYAISFKTLKDAEKVVNQLRQEKWDDTSLGK